MICVLVNPLADSDTSQSLRTTDLELKVALQDSLIYMDSWEPFVYLVIKSCQKSSVRFGKYFVNLNTFDYCQRTYIRWKVLDSMTLKSGLLRL